MKIKKFLKKYKAALIVLLAVIVALANYLLYPVFIKKDMQLIEVPIVNVTINPGTKITEEMLGTQLTNKDMIPKNVVLSKEEVVGNYTAVNYTIPQKGFIYKEALSSEKQTLGNVYYGLSENQVAYTIKIDAHQYKDGKFKVGQLIDIYFRCESPQEAGMDYVIGKLQNNVKIISISQDDGTYITLAINQEDLKYYLIAEKIGEIIPVLDIEANGEESEKQIFSENSTRQYLETKAMVLLVPNDAETEEVSVDEVETGAIDKPQGNANGR